MYIYREDNLMTHISPYIFSIGQVSMTFIFLDAILFLNKVSFPFFIGEFVIVVFTIYQILQ